jgi:hypothetical protein
VSDQNIYKSDAESLQRIIDALNAADPDSRERILSTAATFFGYSTRRGSNEAIPSARNTGVAFSEERLLSPKEFILQRQPQTDVERVACLAYYLAHYRDMPQFKTFDISQLNTEAAQRKFSNAAFAVNNAIQSGFLVSVTKGLKQLSAHGEQFVEMLPDREAARRAMSHARPRRKAKRDKNSAE